jgi:hypothetical protein
MGLVDKQVSSKIKKQLDEDLLTLEEYEFLFTIIKNSTFRGESLENLYKIVLKLQKQYLTLKEKLQ